MGGLATDRLKELVAMDGRPVRTQANLMGFQRNMFYRYLGGENAPSIANLKRIAAFYGVSTDYLLGMDRLAL